jgi:hypothetical protein
MKNKNEKTIIIIDGLDEASKDLFQLVPKSNYENILIIVSSRTISRSIDFFQHNILENKKEITLEGLIEDDIITLIDSNFKYKLSLKEKEHIIKVSSGNPLYLNLLSNSINSEKLSNFNLYEIPNEIHEFYENIIKRYNNIDKKYLDFFILLSIVKDYLSSNEVGFS